MGSVSRDSIVDVWGPRTTHDADGSWPERVDERTSEEPDHWVQSACLLCSNGCGCDVGVKNGRIVGVRGRGVDTVSRGRLGPKGLHAWEANNSPDRLTRPLIRRDGRLEPASWDEAMDLLVSRTREIRSRYTASAIGFYTSGQLFLEEYYTLALIGKAGLGTPHMDGNTRLCTATAAAALKQTFGCDGQPGSYEDIDVTDCLLHVGHNMAHTDTVLWMRVLDRRRGPNPPAMVVIDPRRTPTAKEADVHLMLRVGTNAALLNGLNNLLIEGGYADEDFIQAHTVGYAEFKKRVSSYSPERVEAISGVPAADLRRAAKLIGEAEGLLSSCLQGVYQSNQGCASAVQVNNVNLLLGRIGRPGCGILQMNGQPTAQNTRETGADGDMCGFRNWINPDHIGELAELWNVDRNIIPHWVGPTHAMQIFRYCEIGSIRMLWVQGTNPAVSMPDVGRIREILAKEDLFLIVSDAFPTETTELADLVLPTALWGEKTGCTTNVSRTVHITHKAVEPPGEARSDLDIFLDYSRRMDFRDKDGQPLLKWSDAEGAFNGWRECTRGRPCDYTGLSYAKLSEGSGIPWPCNSDHPEGSPRIYEDLHFSTDADYCESYGEDLDTGAPVDGTIYRAANPAGRAIFKSVDYRPPAEQPDDAYPFFLTTGRLVYHFHTRTKTGRSRKLRDAAPDAFVQIAAEDAERLGVADGDWVRVSSRRGFVEQRARLGDIGAGQVFIPFHFGYWDSPERSRAANELTIFAWDPVSKQPHLKYAAVHLERVDHPEPVAMPRHPAEVAEPKHLVSAVANEFLKEHAHLGDYLAILSINEDHLAEALGTTKTDFADIPDIVGECSLLAEWSRNARLSLAPICERFPPGGQVTSSHSTKVFAARRPQHGLNLLLELQNLLMLGHESFIVATLVQQAAKALRDKPLLATLEVILVNNARQRQWLTSRMRLAAAQVLLVPL